VFWLLLCQSHDFPLSRWWIGFGALLRIYARLGVQLVILGFVGPRILQIGSSQAVLSFLSKSSIEERHELVCSLFRSSIFCSAPSVFLKDVAVRLALPYGQKLSKALLVSLGFLWGVPRSGSYHFWMEFGFMRL
jgi:hypothetical protein